MQRNSGRFRSVQFSRLQFSPAVQSSSAQPSAVRFCSVQLGRYYIQPSSVSAQRSASHLYSIRRSSAHSTPLHPDALTIRFSSMQPCSLRTRLVHTSPLQLNPTHVGKVCAVLSSTYQFNFDVPLKLAKASTAFPLGTINALTCRWMFRNASWCSITRGRHPRYGMCLRTARSCNKQQVTKN